MMMNFLLQIASRPSSNGKVVKMSEITYLKCFKVCASSLHRVREEPVVFAMHSGQNGLRVREKCFAFEMVLPSWPPLSRPRFRVHVAHQPSSAKTTLLRVRRGTTMFTKGKPPSTSRSRRTISSTFPNYSSRSLDIIRDCEEENSRNQQKLTTRIFP